MTDKLENQFSAIVNSSKCLKEFNAYDDCMKTVKKKGDKELCKEKFKLYQFCLVKREDDRLHMSSDWIKFKNKWGHLPSEEDSNIPKD